MHRNPTAKPSALSPQPSAASQVLGKRTFKRLRLLRLGKTTGKLWMMQVVHRAGDAKEVHEESEGHPEALVVKESAALQDATN